MNARFQQIAKTGATGNAIVAANAQEAYTGCVNVVRRVGQCVKRAP